MHYKKGECTGLVRRPSSDTTPETGRPFLGIGTFTAYCRDKSYRFIRRSKACREIPRSRAAAV
jgi:hypothetical protein